MNGFFENCSLRANPGIRAKTYGLKGGCLSITPSPPVTRLYSSQKYIWRRSLVVEDEKLSTITDVSFYSILFESDMDEIRQ